MPIALSNFFGTLNDNAFKQATILAMALSIGAGGNADKPAFMIESGTTLYSAVSAD